MTLLQLWNQIRATVRKEAVRQLVLAGTAHILSGLANTVLSHIISQLRPGADLSKVTLPTFILEPKSMLERITKYAHHTEIKPGL